jgi:peptidoglycan/LPS O-acetylase OafA/YrhL
LVWLGAVSYPLYLIHQNIGYSLILAMQGIDIHRNVAALGATLASLCLAASLHRWGRTACDGRHTSLVARG